MAWIDHQITEILTAHMAGILRKLRERDIMLITKSAVTAVLVYENFGDLAERDKTLGNAMFFETRSASLKFRSAPGVVHELRIRTPEHCRMAGYKGDVVIHSCRLEHRATIERHYKPVMLKDYIKERDMKTEIDKDGFIISAETGDRVIHFECDPFKNTPCRKTACKPLGYDGPGACDVTLNPEYRLDGGQAFYIRFSKTENVNSERVYIDEEDTNA